MWIQPKITSIMSHVVINYLKPGRGGSNHRDPCYLKKKKKKSFIFGPNS